MSGKVRTRRGKMQDKPAKRRGHYLLDLLLVRSQKLLKLGFLDLLRGRGSLVRDERVLADDDIISLTSAANRPTLAS